MQKILLSKILMAMIILFASTDLWAARINPGKIENKVIKTYTRDIVEWAKDPKRTQIGDFYDNLTMELGLIKTKNIGVSLHIQNKDGKSLFRSKGAGWILADSLSTEDNFTYDLDEETILNSNAYSKITSDSIKSIIGSYNRVKYIVYKHKIEIEGGKADKESALEGDTVRIIADSLPKYIYNGWDEILNYREWNEINYKDRYLKFNNRLSYTTWFIMPDRPVNIKTTYFERFKDIHLSEAKTFSDLKEEDRSIIDELIEAHLLLPKSKTDTSDGIVETFYILNQDTLFSSKKDSIFLPSVEKRKDRYYIETRSIESGNLAKYYGVLFYTTGYHNISIIPNIYEDSAKYNTKINIYCPPTDSTTFYKWIVKKGKVELNNKYNDDTSFLMPDEDVEIEAFCIDNNKTYTFDVANINTHMDMVGLNSYALYAAQYAGILEKNTGDTTTYTKDGVPMFGFAFNENVPGQIEFFKNNDLRRTDNFTMTISKEVREKLAKELNEPEICEYAKIEFIFAPKHKITVINATASASEAFAGDSILITADLIKGNKYHSEWRTYFGETEISDIYIHSNDSMYIIMPDDSLFMEAIYEDRKVGVFNLDTLAKYGEYHEDYYIMLNGLFLDVSPLTKDGNYYYSDEKLQFNIQYSGGSQTVTLGKPEDRTNFEHTFSNDIVSVFPFLAKYTKVKFIGLSQHSIKINHGHTDKDSVIFGEEISIKAEEYLSGNFVKWEVVKGNVILEDSTSAETTFMMPDEDVEIRAVYDNDITSVKETASDDILIYAIKDEVFNPEKLQMSIFSIDGKLIYAGCNSTVSLEKGNYIIRTDNKTIKVVIE